MSEFASDIYHAEHYRHLKNAQFDEVYERMISGESAA